VVREALRGCHRVPIPRRLAEAIDKIAGQRQRTAFIVELLERELRRREQREALREAAGSWKDVVRARISGFEKCGRNH
jgi:hypothetical protein